MKKPDVSLALTAIAAVLLLSPTAFAQAAQVDDQRLENQQQRINSGVSGGTINPAVAAHDERGLNRDQERINYDQSHGGVTQGDQRRIRRSEDRHSRHIRHQRLINR